ncbi:Hsp33 family molecular chaperone HslO [Vagococcus acidifermentans]|uniref:33 kDa chaperonin n=1 Tax=Vagococcus acidifermentans TaxID=564710 RepID=A0A430AUH5_9ENTE|nr:Hsp33 family molecular chaperone HslO [Vagococcus acidifermentans]RSU11711.1 Hsp33 family molecular chaperone [Vagococcus acidifermentans]
MNDYLVKALCYDGQIRAMAVRSTETVAEAKRRHKTWRGSSVALGRGMTGALLLGAMLKNEEKLTVKIQGDGTGGAIIIDANAKGDVKGYIQNPQANLPSYQEGKINVRDIVGTNGSLTVIKDLGLKEPFSGQVPLISGELGEDFTYYLANSEQTPSSVGLSVLIDFEEESVKAAGGFVIQVMPGATDDTLTDIENRLKELPAISALLDEGKSPEGILESLFGADNIEILDTMPVQFKCDCSKERFAEALIAVGEKDLREMIEEDGGAEAVCHFCENKYYFTAEELEQLIIEGKS